MELDQEANAAAISTRDRSTFLTFANEHRVVALAAVLHTTLG